MATRTDGRPVIVYRDVSSGLVSLFDCLDRACARFDETGLTYLGYDGTLPALALDKAGRILLAYQDPVAGRIELAACSGGRCRSAGVARIRHGLGEGLAMTLDGQGRPAIAWTDIGGRDSIEVALNVTTVLDAGDLVTSRAAGPER